ncbi:unnamed protein product [Arctia plantaginis]|uniref:Endonuclease/exonuclease/phosphatase domain-containing protein n=1 Tax=Arctia plantaginis TaxID=874455 RepID=A0A8S1B712_ARCPL|nr:unnamed protein product [Arctia plantaginis]
MSGEEEDYRRLLEEQISAREEEMKVLEEMSAEAGFRPRQSLQRTPPSHFGHSSPQQDQQLTAATASGKRPLASPQEVQEAVRRRIQAARRPAVPPVGGILSAPIPTQPTSPECSSEPGTLSGAERTVQGATQGIAVSEQGPVDVDLADVPAQRLAGMATAATKGIMEAVRSKTSRLNKDEVAAIGAHTERLSAVIAHLAIRLAAAEAASSSTVGSSLETRTSGSDAKRTGVVSYSDALKLSKGAAPMPIPKRLGPAVVIYPSEESREEVKTAEDTKRLLRSAVDPSKLGVQIAGVRKVGNAGVVVQTTSREAAEVLKKAMPQSLRVGEPRERRPLVALSGMETGLPFDAVLSKLKEQNLEEEAQWPLEKLKAEMKLLFTRKRGNRTVSVFSCTPGLRRLLIEKGRIYVGWEAGSSLATRELPRVARDHGLDVVLVQEPYNGVRGEVDNAVSIVAAGGTSKAGIYIPALDVRCAYLEALCTSHCVVCHMTWGCRGAYLVSAYFQYAEDISVHIHHLERVLEVLRGEAVLIGVDTNAHSPMWHSDQRHLSGRGREARRRREEMEALILSRDLLVHNRAGQPHTFSSENGESNIDVTISTRGVRTEDWRVMEDAIESDHRLICFELPGRHLGGPTPIAEPLAGTPVRYRERGVDWDRFRNMISNHVGRVDWGKPAEVVSKRFTDLVVRAAVECLGARGEGKTTRGYEWWSPALEALRRDLRRGLRWTKGGVPLSRKLQAVRSEEEAG